MTKEIAIRKKGNLVDSKDKNYNLLIKQKNELKSQINELNISLDKENPEVAIKINNFELEREKISKEVENLTQNLEILKKKLSLVTTNIYNFFGGKKQVLLDAIKEKMKGKRFFFFKDPKELLFDCETGYLWENLDYVGLPSGSVNSVTSYILPKRKTGGITNWNLPYIKELARMIYSKQYPFNSNNYWYIKLNKYEFNTFLYRYGGSIDFNSFINKNYNNSASYYREKNPYLLCNPTFATKDLDPSSKVFTENEKAEKILNIFLSNNWIPKFDDEKLTDLYIKLFRERPALIKEYAEIEQKISKSLEKSKKFTKTFDFERELLNYDLNIVNRSLLNYNDNIISWLNHLLDGIKDFKKDESKILNRAIEINQKLKTQTSENDVITERNTFLKENLDFEIETTEFVFIKMKKEVLELQNKIKRTTDLEKLAKFEEIKYPSFIFMAEHTSNILNEKLKSIDWFRENVDVINSLLEINEEWSNDFKQFDSIFKQEFIKKCKEEMIEDKIYDLWVESWTEERVMLEEKFLPLIKAGLENIISFDILSKIEKSFKTHRENLKNFYMNKRIDIYNKNESKDEDGLFDKIAYEKEMSEITENFSKSIEDLIFSQNSTETRLFITELISSWFESRVTELISLSEKNTISENMTKLVLNRFRDFKKSEFNNYIKSKESYANYREKQFSELQSLLRKMSVSLKK